MCIPQRLNRFSLIPGPPIDKETRGDCVYKVLVDKIVINLNLLVLKVCVVFYTTQIYTFKLLAPFQCSIAIFNLKGKGKNENASATERAIKQCTADN